MVRTLMLSCMFWIGVIAQGWSQTGDTCGSLIRQYEAAHGIPHKLLTAISLVESGQKPWTINANGKPYVFPTKKEAITMVRKLRRMGMSSIDVGCMQVNLKQHPDAFPTLEAAFDPATNIAYAAKFLKAKKMNTGTWGRAVAHYHSSKPEFHLPYRTKVLKKWAKVQNGRLTLYEPIEKEQSTAEMTYSELKKHGGVFVKNVAAPSGRRLPMIVQFAPYKGFNRRAPGSSSALESLVSGPKIIRVMSKGNRKVIISTIGGVGYRKPFLIQGAGTPARIIPISAKRN